MNGGPILAALALLAVTACTSDNARPDAAPTPAESPSESSSWFPSPTPTPNVPFEVTPGSEAAARRLVSDAIDHLIDADSGEYAVVATASGGDETIYKETGRYSLLDLAFDVTRTYTTPTLVVAHVRNVGEENYIQMESWPQPMSGCWMWLSPELTRQATGVNPPAGPVLPLPLAVFAASRVVGVSSADDNVVEVNAPVRDVLQMMGFNLRRLQELAIPRSSRTSLRASFVSGHLAELTVDGVSVLLDLEGVKVNAVEQAMIGDADVVASFYSVGEPVRVSPPAEKLLVRTDAEAEKGCVANR